MIRRYLSTARRLALNVRDVEKILINQGRQLARDYRTTQFADLRQAEFQVFSQWGEDGIIQYLVQNLTIEHKTFVEFGVETFTEANCRYLLMNDYWQGLVIDGSSDNIRAIEDSGLCWKYGLQCIDSFVTRDNILELIAQANFPGVGILSVDIDGMDYHVLERAIVLRPAIVIVEYNATFGPDAKVTIPYDATFYRTNAHHSNLYFGASLAGFDHLLSEHGYAIVAGNSAGNNGFFVRRDLLNDRVRATTAQAAYAPACFAESRDSAGQLTYLRGPQRLKAIADMPVIDVTSGREMLAGDIILP